MQQEDWWLEKDEWGRQRLNAIGLALEHYEEEVVSLEAAPVGIPAGVGLIRGVMDQHLSHLKFDKQFAARVRRYALAFVTKNEDHIQFFGNALLGVYPVRFTDDDRNNWFDQVMNCEERALRHDLLELPTVIKDWIVSSDTMNQSVIYLLHRVHHSKQMSPQEIERCKVDLISILHFKFISSLMSYYFKYPADREVALATYASLSKKYDIKVYGSWRALIKARAESIVAKQGIHYQTYVRYDSDKDITYMINDVQGRIREVVKSLNEEFYAVRDRNTRISSSSNTMDLDGDRIVRDRTKAFTVYRRYLQTTLTDRASFIREPLVNVVSDAMSGVAPAAIKEGLIFLQEHYEDPKHRYIQDFVDEALMHAFEYIQRTNTMVTDLAKIVSKLRAIYTASRSSDASVMKLRELGDRIVGESVSSKNDNVRNGARTALILYIVLRALTKQHFS